LPGDDPILAVFRLCDEAERADGSGEPASAVSAINQASRIAAGITDPSLKDKALERIITAQIKRKDFSHAFTTAKQVTDAGPKYATAGRVGLAAVEADEIPTAEAIKSWLYVERSAPGNPDRHMADEWSQKIYRAIEETPRR